MIGTLPGCFVNEEAESQRKSEASWNSSPQVRSGLNFQFPRVAPTGSRPGNSKGFASSCGLSSH